MTDIDFIIISQSDIVNSEEYSKLPLDRIELYKALIYPRMIYFKGGFRSHLEVINYFNKGRFYSEADYPERRKLFNIWNLPSMNGLYLANYLSQYSIKTKIINNFDSEWDLLSEVYLKNKRKPLVGISSTFHLSYPGLQRIAKKLQTLDSAMEIAVGGAFVNEQMINGEIKDFEQVMRKYKLNYILYAFNSEKDLKDLILVKKDNADIEKVNNLAYLGAEGGFHLTSSVWNEPPLDELPGLWDKLEPTAINRTIQMRTSSGCAFACAFCSYPVTAKGFHAMNCEQVEKHIRSVLSIPGVTRIIFIDDTFNIPVPRFKEMCRLFAKYDFEWFSFLRVQFVDDEIVKLMKESGCRGVYLGLESSNDNILRNMNKKATRAEFLKGIELLKKHGIITLAAFIIGFPGETEESIEENIKFIEETGLDYYTLKEFYYMQHTSIHEKRDKFGLTGIGSNWKHDTMDYNLAHLKKIEMLKRIKKSIFIDPDTSLWYLAYLYDQGMSFELISRVQREINEIMIDQIDNKFDDNSQNFRNLQNILIKESS